jgi:catechol 2,3-dioxygenase-like lactoylglutathione lyase family enzyme
MRMSRKEWAVGIAGFLFGSLVHTQLGGAQPGPSFDGTLSHVGIVVRDVDKAAKVFADVFSVEVPQTRMSPILPYPPSYGGATTAVKITSFIKGNVRLELIEPIEGSSPWRDFLEKRGEGIHHLAFDMGGWNTAVKRLESKGGKWILGNETVNFAYVDMTPQLGFTLEVFGPGGARLPQKTR